MYYCNLERGIFGEWYYKEDCYLEENSFATIFFKNTQIYYHDRNENGINDAVSWRNEAQQNNQTVTKP